MNDGTGAALGPHVPRMWSLRARVHAAERLPVFLGVRQLQDAVAAQAGRLLRLLFLRLGEVPAGPGAEGVLRLGLTPGFVLKWVSLWILGAWVLYMPLSIPSLA